MSTLITALRYFALLASSLCRLFLALSRMFGLYTIVEEGRCHVYVLFGKVVATIDEPGLHILLFKLGLKAPIVAGWAALCAGSAH